MSGLEQKEEMQDVEHKVNIVTVRLIKLSFAEQ